MKPANWKKLTIVTALVPTAMAAWVVMVKLVDVSRAPQQIRELSTETKEGFKQVNNRLDYFIGENVTNDNTSVGKN